MFGNKNKKPNIEQDLATKVNQDLVVRNMPNFNKANAYRPTPSINQLPEHSVLSNMSPVKHNFKAVGLFIILGGVIFIGALAYASYVYVIKPQTNKNNTPVVAPAPLKNSIVDTINEVRPTTTEAIITASTSEVALATTSDANIASSSASSTMNEELLGKTNVDAPPLLDSDSDGLSDEEELALGTNAQVADSNNNSYSDLTEVNNNYNPAGSGKLSANTNLSKYTNKTFAYEILAPKGWAVKSLNNDSTVTFTAPDDSIIQISVQDNSERQSILGWYGNSFPDITVTYDKLKTVDNWDGVMGEDSLNFYLTDKKRNNVYVISYIPAVDGRLAYTNIFKLMINSFLIK
jgi:hypothetical protein